MGFKCEAAVKVHVDGRAAECLHALARYVALEGIGQLFARRKLELERPFGRSLASRRKLGGRLRCLLFGSLLGIAPADVHRAVALDVACVAILLAAGRGLLATSFAPATAGALGFRRWRYDAVLLLLLGASVVTCSAAIGGFVETPGCSFANRCPLAVAQCRHEKPPLVELRPGHTSECFRAREVYDDPPRLAAMPAAGAHA